MSARHTFFHLWLFPLLFVLVACAAAGSDDTAAPPPAAEVQPTAEENPRPQSTGEPEDDSSEDEPGDGSAGEPSGDGEPPPPSSEETDEGESGPAAVPTPPMIAVASRTEVTNADGSLTQNLTLEDNSLGIAQILVRAPARLDVGQAGFVTLTIFPVPPVEGAQLAPVTETGEVNATQSVTDSAQIYPIMKADLTGAAFAIELDGDAQRLVTTDMPTDWLWSVQPRESGDPRLVASLSVPVQVEGSEDSTSRVVRTFPVTIATSKTFAQRMEENMDVILTSLLGVLGGGVTLGWRAWRNRTGKR